MDIREWTYQANLPENIAALEKTEEELLEDDETYQPIGEEAKAQLLTQLREEYEQFKR